MLGDARDFNNIETRAVIKFFFFSARQGAESLQTLEQQVKKCIE